jgi:RNA polymerase sigma-70 factor (subfamily 1)
MNEVVNPDPAALLERARAGDVPALGRLLESYRGYLTVLAGVQIGRRLQGKVDAADVVQEAFLGAARDFAQFRGTTEAELLAWLRQVLASVLSNLVRHYQGTQRRDVRLERRLHWTAAWSPPKARPASRRLVVSNPCYWPTLWLVSRKSGATC